MWLSMKPYLYAEGNMSTQDRTAYKQFRHPAWLSTNIHKLVFNPWVDVHM